MLANAAVRNKSPEAFRTISEVATELDVPQHVLRFWEGRFTQIKPVKRAGGRRYYRPEDVDLLRGIRANRARVVALAPSSSTPRASSVRCASLRYCRTIECQITVQLPVTRLVRASVAEAGSARRSAGTRAATWNAPRSRASRSA